MSTLPGPVNEDGVFPAHSAADQLELGILSTATPNADQRPLGIPICSIRLCALAGNHMEQAA
jgi:hypothetical protein